MFFSFSRTLVLSAAPLVVAVFSAALCPTPGWTQDIHPKTEPVRTAQRTLPPVDFHPFGIFRQDLFDRRNLNNRRSDYAPPPAQPGQF